VARVFVASSTRADALSLKVNGPLTDLDGLPFALALSNPVLSENSIQPRIRIVRQIIA
jgi:hypothetical protein